MNNGDTMISPTYAGPIALALLVALGQGCNARAPGTDEAGPAPVDTGVQTGAADTSAAPAAAAPAQTGRADTTPTPARDTVQQTGADTAPAAPPATPAPAEAGRDSPPAGAEKEPGPAGGQAGGQGLKFTASEYEGWRQYSVNCARCHGQDVLPNPVAANLLVSVAPGGPMESPERFFQVVSEGRPERGMPPSKDLLNPKQIEAIYAYVKGRAEGRLAPGRPERPQS